jgi:streptogramin lyase
MLVACQTQAISTTPPSPTSTNIPPTQPPTSTPNPLGEHVIAEWRINLPEDIAFGFDSVWITGHRDPKNTIRIDPSSTQEIAVIENTGYRAHSVLVAGDFVWVDGEFDDMAKIDPQTNTIVAKVPGGHTALAYGFDSIWSPTRKDELDRIDPSSAKIIASIKLGDGYVDCNNFVIVTVSAVWIGHCDEGELIKVDPTTNRIASKIPISQLIDQAKAQTTIPQGKATDFIWLPLPDPENPQGCGLLQINPETGSGLTFRSVGADCNIPTVTSDVVWLSGNNQIDRFNPTTNQIDETYKLNQGGVWRLGVGFGSIWVIYESVGLVQRLDIAP